MKKNCLLFVFYFLGAYVFAQSLTDSLKAYYDFNGNALDQSGYGQNGTVYNAVLAPDRFGNPNSAYYFNGINAYIEALTSAQMRPNTFPVSFSAWVKFSASPTTPYPVFISDYTATGDYNGFLLSFLSGANMNQAQSTYGDGGMCTSSTRRTKQGMSNVGDNQWHLLVAVIRGATDMDVYLDCVNDGGVYTGSGGGLAYSASQTAHIGHSRCGSSDYYYQGYIDDIRFYHRALTQADVIALYNYPTPITPITSIATNVLGADSYLCTGQNLTLNASVPWGATYSWSNGSTSPTTSVNQTGMYWVDIIGNGCGQHGRDSIFIRPWQDIDIVADTSICKSQTMVLDATANFSNYSWSTGATTQSISTTFAGTYYVNLVDATGCAVVDTIHVAYGGNFPQSYFTYTFQSSGVVQFTNTSNYGLVYEWYFDGVLDTTMNPSHYFACNTPIQVSLVAKNDCGNDTTTETITYICNGIAALEAQMSLQIFPIPTSQDLNISYKLTDKTNVALQMYDELGRVVLSVPATSQVGEIKTHFSLANLPNGIYALHLVTEKGRIVRKIQVMRGVN